MNWFLVAIIAPLIWSFLNHADKYLVSKFHSVSGVGGLVTFSSIFSVVLLPFVLFFRPDVLHVSLGDGILLIASGAVFTLAVLFSMFALEKDDASYIVPFWQLTPVFAYVLGFFFLGETLLQHQIMGGAIVILGAVILSFEFKEGIRFNTRPVVFMILSSLCLAISDVIFKGVSFEGDFWSSIFWNQIGMTLFGLVCFVLIRTYRTDFLQIVRSKNKKLLSINIVGEILLVTANVVNYFAMLLAPVSLVLLVNYSFQPLFVFAEGVLLSVFLPHIATERLNKGHITQKILSIAIMGIGIYFVYN
jgi:drug/metabolite transporter (DMT)-like permease